MGWMFIKKSKENNMNPRLPIDRSLLKTYTVTAGRSDLSEYNIITGNQLPEQVIVAIVDHDKVDMYASFLENTGISTDDREFGITMDDYYGGSFILAWDRTQDKCNRFHRHISDSGAISINLCSIPSKYK